MQPICRIFIISQMFPASESISIEKVYLLQLVISILRKSYDETVINVTILLSRNIGCHRFFA